MSPIVDGDLVIVSAAISSWGTPANRAHRFVALDKRTGDIVYVASPGGRPYDTATRRRSSRPSTACGCSSCGTAATAASTRSSRRPARRSGASSRRSAPSTPASSSGATTVIVSHGDENLDTSELGMIAAIDGSQTGDIKTTKWAVKGDQFGFSSPVIDGTRVYQIDNGSRLQGASTSRPARELWTQPLGTVQKAPLVLADGKLYVGTESGKFFIVRPMRGQGRGPERGRAAARARTACSRPRARPSRFWRGAAISRGRVFFVSSDAVYAIGPKTAKAVTGIRGRRSRPSAARARRPACRCRRPSSC